MPVTVNIQDQCAAGHGKITLAVDAKTKTFIFNKKDVLDPMTDEEMEIGILFLLRFLKSASGVTTWPQMKTKFTDREISL